MASGSSGGAWFTATADVTVFLLETLGAPTGCKSATMLSDTRFFGWAVFVPVSFFLTRETALFTLVFSDFILRDLLSFALRVPKTGATATVLIAATFATAVVSSCDKTDATSSKSTS